MAFDCSRHRTAVMHETNGVFIRHVAVFLLPPERPAYARRFADTTTNKFFQYALDFIKNSRFMIGRRAFPCCTAPKGERDASACSPRHSLSPSYSLAPPVPPQQGINTWPRPPKLLPLFLTLMPKKPSHARFWNLKRIPRNMTTLNSPTGSNASSEDVLITPLAIDEEAVTTSSLQALQSADQRKVLDIVDKLRRTGLNGVVELPQLVVCGDQSSGKSSVLEAITEIPFPRKENLCTRFATEVSSCTSSLIMKQRLRCYADHPTPCTNIHEYGHYQC
jgi:hypothetical protein